MISSHEWRAIVYWYLFLCSDTPTPANYTLSLHDALPIFVHDSYQTVRSLTFVLPSGIVIDTAAPDAEERFAAAEPALASGLEQIRDELRADAELAERVRRKFRIKNTMRYRLVAFLDAQPPV